MSHLHFFKFSFDKVVDYHIEHRFSQEMSQKSTVVSSLSCMCSASKQCFMVTIVHNEVFAYFHRP